MLLLGQRFQAEVPWYQQEKASDRQSTTLQLSLKKQVLDLTQPKAAAGNGGLSAAGPNQSPRQDRDCILIGDT